MWLSKCGVPSIVVSLSLMLECTLVQMMQRLAQFVILNPSCHTSNLYMSRKRTIKNGGRCKSTVLPHISLSLLSIPWFLHWETIVANFGKMCTNLSYKKKRIKSQKKSIMNYIWPNHVMWINMLELFKDVFFILRFKMNDVVSIRQCISYQAKIAFQPTVTFLKTTNCIHKVITSRV
jgi:hypothetical protein